MTVPKIKNIMGEKIGFSDSIKNEKGKKGGSEGWRKLLEKFWGFVVYNSWHCSYTDKYIFIQIWLYCIFIIKRRRKIEIQ